VTYPKFVMKIFFKEFFLIRDAFEKRGQPKRLREAPADLMRDRQVRRRPPTQLSAPPLPNWFKRLKHS
jgi:hypothetical protein